MGSMEFGKYVDIARKKGADHAVIVDTYLVRAAPWVRLKCEFGCEGYGLRRSCPPYTPDYERTRSILDSYKHAMLVHRHWIKGYELVNTLNDLIVDLEATLFLDGYYKAFGMGCGPCTRCKKCDTSKNCIHPERMRPSMESCGIDVFQTARAQRLPIEAVRDHAQQRDVYGLVLIE
jgi:predicted metal-binding protein